MNPIPYLKEIGQKLWNLGKIVIPILSLWEFVVFLCTHVFTSIKDWVIGLFDEIKAKFLEQLQLLSVDLTPPPEFLALMGKINTVIPLDVAWSHLLLYLAFASFVVGIKWARNLIPGLK